MPETKMRGNTIGGKQSLACFRRTENPPWVLVSEAVKILQKEQVAGVGGSGTHGSGLVGSLCCKYQPREE